MIKCNDEVEYTKEVELVNQNQGRHHTFFQGLIMAKVLRLLLQKLMNIARINAG
jgi:hypothetical protein